MLYVFGSLALVALGMGVDAYYQRKIRIAECDAYETGYEHAQRENQIKREILVPEFIPVPKLKETPSMDAPVEMPPTFDEHMRKHGRATARLR